MTKLQSAMLSVAFLCMVLVGVTYVVKAPQNVRDQSVGAMAAVCFLTSLVFFGHRPK